MGPKSVMSAASTMRYSLVAACLLLSASASSQTFTVLHTFTGMQDGAGPYAGLTLDRGGNLYGTTSTGGPGGAGTVFRLKHSGADWILEPIYSFNGALDGGFPYYGGVTIAEDGSLYGTTSQGGSNTSGCGSYGCGTAFHINPQPTPPATARAPWDETVIRDFSALNDGWDPASNVVFDASGNVYGTTLQGRTTGHLSIFERAFLVGHRKVYSVCCEADVVMTSVMVISSRACHVWV
jgi:uncharacterized repeat protein (TIGR03803 family)